MIVLSKELSKQRSETANFLNHKSNKSRKIKLTVSIGRSDRLIPLDKDGVTIFILDDRVIINFGVTFLLQLQIINDSRYSQARENGQLDIEIRQLSLRLQMLQVNVVDDHGCEDDLPYIQRKVIAVEL